jgi:hypothetical protein
VIDSQQQERADGKHGSHQPSHDDESRTLDDVTIGIKALGLIGFNPLH